VELKQLKPILVSDYRLKRFSEDGAQGIEYSQSLLLLPFPGTPNLSPALKVLLGVELRKLSQRVGEHYLPFYIKW